MADSVLSVSRLEGKLAGVGYGVIPGNSPLERPDFPGPSSSSPTRESSGRCLSPPPQLSRQ